MVSASEGTLAVDLVTVEGDGVDAVRLDVRGVDREVDLVGARDGVRREERDDLERREVAGVREAREDRVDAVLRLGDQPVDGRRLRIGPASEEFDARCALRSVSAMLRGAI